MNQKIIEERTMPLEEYLAQFPADSADYKLIKQKSENIASITVQVVEEGDGRRFEDTIFKEKSGISYTIRTAL